jgi:hypothetical protein
MKTHTLYQPGISPSIEIKPKDNLRMYDEERGEGTWMKMNQSPRNEILVLLKNDVRRFHSVDLLVPRLQRIQF